VGDRRKQVGDPWRRFAILFGTLAVGSELFYYGVVLESNSLQVYLGALASLSGGILSWIGYDVIVDGVRISNARFAVEIADGCDAIQLCTLLTAAVIAFPVPLGRRLRAVCLGLLWLQSLNFARIVSLFLIGMHSAGVFTSFHRVIWPTTLILITVTTWVGWVLWGYRSDAGREAHSA
jgi:exosortase H (IPTLxxWG-CTERM-specific)